MVPATEEKFIGIWAMPPSRSPAMTVMQAMGWDYAHNISHGRFVDPMRIRLPRGRVLEGPIVTGFEKERDRVEGMMQRKAGVASSN